MKKTLLVLQLAMALCASAQNLFKDDLSPYIVDSQLSGQGTWTNNSSNPGGLGAAIIGDGGANAKVTASGINYAGYGSSANSLEIHPNADGCGTAFPAVTSGDIYVGFVLNLSAAQANNNSDFFRVLSGGNFNTTFRLYAINAGFSYYLSVAKGANGNPVAQSPLSYSYGDNHLVIVKYSQLPGAGDDIVSVYIDPTYANGEPVSPSITTNTGGDQSGNIDRMSFRQNWTNGMPTGKTGLISVAKTWADLGFLPLAIKDFNHQDSLIIVTENAKNGKLQIQCNSEINASIKIFSVLGKEMEKQDCRLNSGKNELSIEPLASGIYIVEIDDNGTKFNKKILVK